NVVQNRQADSPDFWNTAWSLQIIRGAILFVVCLLATLPLAHLYDASILAIAIPVSALYFLISSLNSISIFLLQRRLQLAKLNLFETSIEFVSAVAHIVLAYISPTLWALLIGGLTAATFRMIGSHFLLSEVRHKLFISKDFAFQIFTFGKWVFLSSV